MKLCSACLMGMKCTHRNDTNTKDKIVELSKKQELIAVCPEQLGGLSTPRETAVMTGTADEVINGHAKVVTKSGKDVTENFIRGAEEVLRIAKICNVTEAIFKQNSPSCGCGKIYDFTDTGKKIAGNGVTTTLLKRNGVHVISDEDL